MGHDVHADLDDNGDVHTVPITTATPAAKTLTPPAKPLVLAGRPPTPAAKLVILAAKAAISAEARAVPKPRAKAIPVEGLMLPL